MACFTPFCVVGVENIQIYDIFFIWAEFHIYLLRAPLLKEGLKDKQLLPLLFALCFLLFRETLIIKIRIWEELSMTTPKQTLKYRGNILELVLEI